MARAWRWLAAVRRVLARSSCTSSTDLDALKNNTTIYNPMTIEEINEPTSAPKDSSFERTVQDSTYPEAAVEDSTYSERTVDDSACSKDENQLLMPKESISQEDRAAVTIQAYFRGHLARRAFRALKSLVRLQAVVRGVCVRRQARVAIHCMQALVRLQVRVRARQLLDKSGEVEALASS